MSRLEHSKLELGPFENFSNLGLDPLFKGKCISVFADGAGLFGNNNNVKSAAGMGGGGGGGGLAPWGTRTTAAPVDLIITGEAIVVVSIATAATAATPNNNREVMAP